MNTKPKSSDNTSTDKVQIVMATYNGERYLGAQIESIIHQTHVDWHLLIRDDGSTDNTIDIIKQYAAQDSRISLVSDNMGNLGYIKNFYHLLSMTSEHYICICDQDDIWHSEKIATSLQKLKALETEQRIPALVHSDAAVVDSNLNVISERFIGNRGKKEGINGLLFANSVQGASVMINSALRNYALRLMPDIPYDYHLALIAELIGRRAFIPEPLLNYRQHSNNVIGAKKEGEVKQNENKISSSLKISLGLYPFVKNVYSHVDTSDMNRQYLAEYCYLFEGKSRLKKSYIFLKNFYPFYRRKDQLTCFALLILGRDLKALCQ
jgi:glycosyltransferase involved in cell wall biosynthesis